MSEEMKINTEVSVNHEDCDALETITKQWNPAYESFDRCYELVTPEAETALRNLLMTQEAERLFHWETELLANPRFDEPVVLNMLVDKDSKIYAQQNEYRKKHQLDVMVVHGPRPPSCPKAQRKVALAHHMAANWLAERVVSDGEK